MKRRAFLRGLCSTAAIPYLVHRGLSSTAAAAPARRPNVLFIMTDQQSADAMSCRMGKQWLNTPVMDALVAGGMLFTRAYSSNPLCMPLRASLFTGRYPHETRVQTNDIPEGGVDPKEFVSMGTYFKNAGYDAAYSGKWHLFFNAKDPAEHGFEIMNTGGKDNHDVKTADGAIEFLGRTHDKPFLLVASFLNPHNICEWARRLSGMQQTLNCGEIGDPPPPDRLPPAAVNAAPPAGEPDGMTLMRKAYHNATTFPVGNFTEMDWRKQRWGYYRMIEKVDGEIGRVLEALRKTGQEDNTLIIFTADHGECAGAHGFNQKTVLYEESVRVPMIVNWKGSTPAAQTGKLVNTGIDILPTMLDAAGLEIPKKLPGRSLWPLASGKPVSEWRDYVVVQDDMAQAGELDGIKPRMQGRMLRTDRYKYCLFSRGQRRESLIDLQADPGEMNDLAADPKHREILLKHREMLARFGRELNDALIAEMLADDVKPVPFTQEITPAKAKKKKRKEKN